MITEYIIPQPHLWKPRTRPVRLIFLHATRGGSATQAIEYTATKNWFQSPNNNAGGTWGGCASRIIGPLGEHCIVMDDDKYPTYSGCYGAIGPPQEYCVDEYAISYELAQQNNQIRFTEAQYVRLAQEVAADCRKHGIPPVMVDVRSGQFYPVPTGITRHDRTANGVKLGKSDPGTMFDEAKFLGLLKAELEEDMALTDEDINKIAQATAKLIREEGVYVRVKDGPGYIYRLTPDQELAHVKNPTAMGLQDSEWKVTDLPKDDPLWNLKVSFDGVPEELR